MEDQSPVHQRRRFLQIMIGGIGVALGALFGWPALRFLLPSNESGAAGPVRVARSSVPVGQAHFFDFRGRPAVLIATAPGEYLALSAVCTHLGCIVKWVTDQNEFVCPCHGGRFAPDGRVVGGPPPRPLENYPVTIQDDQLLVG